MGEGGKEPRGQEGIREFTFSLGEASLRCAVVSGLGNARRLLEEIKAGRAHFDFVEVMACPGGCAGGGGQPIHNGEERAEARGNWLWKLDAKNPIRFSHENPDIQVLYREYLGKPLSDKAHHLLHTDLTEWNMPSQE